jgi:hypothetical protein
MLVAEGRVGYTVFVEDVLSLPLIDLVGGARSGSMGEPSTGENSEKTAGLSRPVAKTT